MRTTATILRWEDPPNPKGAAKGGGKSRWDALAAELVDESGRWAVVFEGDRNHAGAFATTIKYGRRLCFVPTGSFEAVCRTYNGVVTVYARHVGGRR
jgi:hypothetical protein